MLRNVIWQTLQACSPLLGSNELCRLHKRVTGQTDRLSAAQQLSPSAIASTDMLLTLQNSEAFMAQAEQLTTLEHVGLARMEGLVVADAADEDAAPALVSELCMVSCHLHAACCTLQQTGGFVLDWSR